MTMYKSSFNVTQEVTVEVTIDEVLENIDNDELFNALMEQGHDISDAISGMECDEVLDNFQHYEVISWAVTNLDTDEVLDAFKESDPDGVHEWLKANDDIVNPDWNPNKEEPKPEPVPAPAPLKHPVIVLQDGDVTQVDEFHSSLGVKVGTYKVFGGVIAVDAFNVQFMANTVNNASNILNAIAFASVNLSEV